jgi:hypothetical protein
MERFFQRFTGTMFRCGVILLFLSGLYGADHAWGDSSGLSMEISLKQNQPLGDFQFRLGVPIGLTMVFKNVSGWPVYTEEGFSQVDLHKALMLTDPNQKVHAFMDPTVLVDTMTVPVFLSGRALITAEKLPKEFVRTITITDLRTLFPVANTVTGWYTIQAHQPFMRFASWLEEASVGVLGILNDENNWQGTIDSNKIQFYISPDKGAQVGVQVVNESKEPSEPLFQVPVKVLKKSEIPATFTLEDMWTKVQPVLNGSTNTEGFAVWETGAPCLISDNYTIIAKYGGEYKSEEIVKDSDLGWAPGCTGSIADVIGFVEKQEVVNVAISGTAYNFPETNVYRATFSMDVKRTTGIPSGWLKYNYTRTRMNFVSTGINEVLGTKPNMTIKGVGTVNNVQGYSFEATVVDGSPDSFGIIIKKADGTTYYSAPAKTISGGNLIITLQ